MFEKASVEYLTIPSYTEALTIAGIDMSSICISPMVTSTRLGDDLRSHQWRVCRLSALIAKEMDLPTRDRIILFLASLLHDIGKAFVPDTILNAPRPLTPEEFAVVKFHPEIGARYLAQYHIFPTRVIDIILQHQERFDGTGYPNHLHGNQISYIAKIITLIDSFDAMTNPRPYNRPKSLKDAIGEIIHCSGTHFDPAIVKSFLNLADKELLPHAA